MASPSLMKNEHVLCQQCGHNMGRSKCKPTGEDAHGNPTLTVRCGKCRTVHDITVRFPVKEAREHQLESALHRLLGWSNGGACPDCTMFRAAPSDITWQHHQDCGVLVDINLARALLGYPPEVGHNLEDPEGEMQRLADERARAVVQQESTP